MQTVDVNVIEGFQGQFIDLTLRFADGRTRVHRGVKLLSVGSGGGVVQDAWPTSFRHSEVVGIVRHVRVDNAGVQS